MLLVRRTCRSLDTASSHSNTPHYTGFHSFNPAFVHHSQSNVNSTILHICSVIRSDKARIGRYQREQKTRVRLAKPIIHNYQCVYLPFATSRHPPNNLRQPLPITSCALISGDSKGISQRVRGVLALAFISHCRSATIAIERLCLTHARAR